jgi:hypothetical protein
MITLHADYTLFERFVVIHVVAAAWRALAEGTPLMPASFSM